MTSNKKLINHKAADHIENYNFIDHIDILRLFENAKF